MTDKNSFVDWLITCGKCSSRKLATDCASRVRKLERDFQGSYGESFSLDKQFQTDKGESILALFTKAGQNEEAAKLKPGTLPIGSGQMYPLKSALSRYFEYLAAREQ